MESHENVGIQAFRRRPCSLPAQHRSSLHMVDKAGVGDKKMNKSEIT